MFVKLENTNNYFLIMYSTNKIFLLMLYKINIIMRQKNSVPLGGIQQDEDAHTK